MTNLARPGGAGQPDPETDQLASSVTLTSLTSESTTALDSLPFRPGHGHVRGSLTKRLGRAWWMLKHAWPPSNPLVRGLLVCGDQGRRRIPPRADRTLQ